MPWEQVIEDRHSELDNTKVYRYLCSGRCLGLFRGNIEAADPELILLEPESVDLTEVRGKKTCDNCGETFQD